MIEGDGALSAAVCGDLVNEGAGSCGDAHDGDASGIAAEEMNVGLDPFESQALVMQPGVDCAISGNTVPGEPTEGANLGFG